MKIEESKHSIAELVDLFKRRDLVVNSEYQRAPNLWPSPARSYFIDTILSGYPFPKIYIWEKLNKATLRPIREIVDGQQRMTAIIDFVDDKFALGDNSVVFSGERFSTLGEERKEELLTYTVSVDVIRNAQRPEILQMFRRMNAYTLPLNEAEKRHSEFFGNFKGWVNELLDIWGALLANWRILTSRQIVRMEDAELFAEVAFALDSGIKSTSNKNLRDLYQKYDAAFPLARDWKEKIDGALGVVAGQLSEIQGTHMTKSYSFLSLIIALIHNKWGIPGVEEATGIAPSGSFLADTNIALDGLISLAAAHETKDVTRFKEYVEACLAGSNRAAQRLIRATFILRALQGTL